ncbi:hypothetical protein ES708_30813 [subsurface metagenome]
MDGDKALAWQDCAGFETDLEMEQEAFGHEEQAGGLGAIAVWRVDFGDFLYDALGRKDQAVDAKDDVGH